MQLVSIQVESFKRVESVTLPVAGVNVLVGANGCGKSSVIQAIHLACCVLRQADRVDSKKTSTVGVDELDYLPTDSYKTLGHQLDWGNKAGTPSSKVTLTFKKDDGAEVKAVCELRSARNAGISVTGVVDADLIPHLRVKRKFYSSYIPGISGIPNKEERRSKKVILKACSFGDSNVILRNVLLLLHNQQADHLRIIEQWIGRIVGPVSIEIDHNDDADLHIKCRVSIEGRASPIELIGTGYLQLIQIFGYVLLFDPGVLLIDEPDIHLHPHVQEKLVQVLADVAKERGTRILLTTHSPFIVRGSPQGTNVSWLMDGKVGSQNRNLVEVALGWGAFGKRVILISEDSNTALLRKIVAQWPEIENIVAFYPGNGYKSAPSPAQAAELSRTLEGTFKILIHRDRDALTDVEVNKLAASYEAEGIGLWLTEYSDIEGYFCSPSFLQAFLGCEWKQANDYLERALLKVEGPVADQFKSQRKAHNEELYKEGGSPSNEDVWAELQGKMLKGAKGKTVFKRLKQEVEGKQFNEDAIFNADLDGRVATDLRRAIERMLA